MTGFDILALIVIVISTGAGWVRGATREIVALFSFILAAVVALIALPVTAPLGRGLINPDWLGVIVAGLVSFLLLYFGVRMLGSALSKGAHAHDQLGVIDRGLGLVIGLVRGLILLGAIHLVAAAALPGERTPRWLTDARVQPVSTASARMIQKVMPGIGRGADALTPVVASSVNRGFSEDGALPPTQTPPNSPPTAP